MKQLTILLFAIFIFSACKKSAENLPANATSSATQNDAVTDAQALLIRFTFNAGPQGWGVTDNAEFVYSENEGKPGGCILGIGEQLSEDWYFLAPPKLLSRIKATNVNALDFLRFDLKAPSTGNAGKGDVIITSTKLTLYLDMPDDPNEATWTTYKVFLSDESDWRVGKIDGNPASNFQVKKALATIKELKIRGSFSSSANKGYLDNVSVVSTN